jgi:hypothetical protein
MCTFQLASSHHVCSAVSHCSLLKYQPWWRPFWALISKHHSIIRMSIDVSRPLNIKAGQYVNIWVPSVNFGHLYKVILHNCLLNERWRRYNPWFDDRTKKEFTQQLFACAEHYLESSKKFQNTGSDEKNLPHAKNYQNLLEKGVVEVMQSKFGYKVSSASLKPLNSIWHFSVNHTAWVYQSAVREGSNDRCRIWYCSTVAIFERVDMWVQQLSGSNTEDTIDMTTTELWWGASALTADSLLTKCMRGLRTSKHTYRQSIEGRHQL